MSEPPVRVDVVLVESRPGGTLRVTQQATLSPERWSRFALGQQILMVADEMNRLQLHPAAARQIPHVLPSPRGA
jgi:hypothetical protein